MRERCIRGRGNRGFIAMLRGLLGSVSLKSWIWGGGEKRGAGLITGMGGRGGWM